MTKQSTITNLLAIPLIASTIFLSSPALAANTQNTISSSEVRNVTNKENIPDTKKGIVGIVTSINGSIILVTSKNNMEFTVDATNATIMKASNNQDGNPAIVNTSDVKVGDAIMVRGIIREIE